jgi:nucleotidyltransferase/DNA polymerase involved in DNA repair
VPLTERLGQAGLYLQRLARCEINRTLAPVDPPLKFQESTEFEDSIADLESLVFVLSLSLDEAYLDVTENKCGLPTATIVARTIREQIRRELNPTASAGVAANKFLAKIASDWRKPDGLFVIRPGDVDTFLPPLPVGRLPGVGKVTDLKNWEQRPWAI